MLSFQSFLPRVSDNAVVPPEATSGHPDESKEADARGVLIHRHRQMMEMLMHTLKPFLSEYIRERYRDSDAYYSLVQAGGGANGYAGADELVEAMLKVTAGTLLNDPDGAGVVLLPQVEIDRAKASIREIVESVLGRGSHFLTAKVNELRNLAH